MLYSLVTCPHRVTMDLFGNPAERDEVNAFVQLLWDRGCTVEQETIAALNIPFVNLQPLTTQEKAQQTREAMAAGASLIYGGRIEADDLVGEPDLLRREGQGYVPIDIKSGSGEEGGDEEEDGKLKNPYAVQLGLYVDVLERLKLSSGRRGYIWDVHGKEVLYDLTQPRGAKTPTTWWDFYGETLTSARGIATRTQTTAPAYASGTCKLCHWYSTCMKAVKAADDLSLIPELGRSTRDVMAPEIPTVAALAGINPEAYIQGQKTVFPRIGADRIRKFQQRAALLRSPDPKPYLKEPIRLPAHDLELFFGAPGKARRFQRVRFPPRQGEEPPHREPSLGLMEVTTWVKRRQGDTRAVTQVKPNEPREK